MNKEFILFTVICLFTGSCEVVNAQAEEAKVVQFSGIVVSGDSLRPVPLTAVYRTRDKQGTFTDVYGFFAIPALVGDTINFSNVGYVNSSIIIPKDLAENRYTVVQMMMVDTVSIPEVFIYPWPTKEELFSDFINLRLPKTESEIARDNLNRVLAKTGGDMADSWTGSDSYRMVNKQRTDELYYAGQPMPNPLATPFSLAWVDFFKALFDGSMKPQ